MTYPTTTVDNHSAVMAERTDIICEFAGHDWQDAGDGMQICAECLSERWTPAPQTSPQTSR